MPKPYGLLAPVFIVCLFAAGAFLPRADAAVSVDNSIWADLLSQYVVDGKVDYQGFQNDEDRLDAYLQILEQVSPDDLEEDERFAFYVNAYNAWTIKLILGKYPDLKSIKDLGSIFKSPWKKKLARIDGELITLDNIEHDILRPQFKDPRVHVAVNCASKSCPPLMAEPFSGAELDRQLDELSIAFVNDRTRNRLEGLNLKVSAIFKWFAEDFNGDVVGFFQKYAQGELKDRLDAEKDKIKLKYLDYDWSLNDL